jgi:hypothetical protein
MHVARSVVHFLRTVRPANGSGVSGVAHFAFSYLPPVGWEHPRSQPTSGKSSLQPAFFALRSRRGDDRVGSVRGTLGRGAIPARHEA